MADGWQTYAFEFNGGLVSNLSPLQQGVQAPGSARILKNFEPSTDGGYRRVEGYDKYDNNFVPAYGEPLVQGSGQSGTLLTIANIFYAPVAGDQFTIDGVTGTYTISSSGVFYDNVHKYATLTLTESLASSPADKASVNFLTHSGLVKGVVAWDSTVVAYRNGDVYRTTGNGFERINKPNYGITLVNGSSQTGTTLTVDGLSATPQVQDTFMIDGVQKVYTVVTEATVSGGGTTLDIYPALASSPADNASITWLSNSRSDGTVLRHTKYRIGTENRIMCVDGYNLPFRWDGTFFEPLTDAPDDVIAAKFVTFHKNQMFFAKGDMLTFTAPYSDDDFNVANGAGVMSVGGEITGIVVFREALIIFTDKTISQLTGNTLQDFTLQPITRNVGCVAPDTIQEIGGDVIFLGPEGLRMLSATDRIGDFSLGVVSKPIQDEMRSLISSSSSFASCVIKQKSQYRIFGFNPNISSTNAKGILGTQMVGNDTSQMNWAELVGFKAYVADSDYINQTETVVFANNSGYIFHMESGNSLDGNNIIATFSTPFVPIQDPRLRKTFYKLVLYADPQGGMTTSVNLKYDFDTLGSVQPQSISLTNVSGTIGFYGSSGATYGTTVFGTKLVKQFKTQVIGSGFTVSLQFVSEGKDPPFSLDAATLEYSLHDRR